MHRGRLASLASYAEEIIDRKARNPKDWRVRCWVAPDELLEVVMLADMALAMTDRCGGGDGRNGSELARPGRPDVPPPKGQ